MRNIILIKNGIVVDIIHVDGEFNQSLYVSNEFDTACDDPLSVFKIGDIYDVSILVNQPLPNEVML